MSEFNFSATTSKEAVFQDTKKYLGQLSLGIEAIDNTRPWGGFFVIKPESQDAFISQYFKEVGKDEIYKYGDQISPKILLVAPEQKLSWQYHHRRAELWKVVSGKVGVIQSESDVQTPLKAFTAGELITHGTEVRHRLVGLENWGVVAEIWQHTDSTNPSDENDIVRLEDSYGRN